MLILMLRHVSSRVSGFPVASPCLWGQNLSCFKVSKPVVTWFCVTGVAVRDILMCLQTCRKSFCMASAVLLRTLQSTLYTPHTKLHTPQTTPHFTVYTAPYTPHCTLYTLHFALHTLHSTLCTLQSTLHTLHYTLYTPLTLHTEHFTLYT